MSAALSLLMWLQRGQRQNGSSLLCLEKFRGNILEYNVNNIFTCPGNIEFTTTSVSFTILITKKKSVLVTKDNTLFTVYSAVQRAVF